MTAPGRGKWDRTRSRAQRTISARAAILSAVRAGRTAHGPALTVGDVVQRAGIGRNTFYRHFGDLAAAAAAANEEGAIEMAEALDRALRDAHTPLERLRALSRTVLDQAGEAPPGALWWTTAELRALEVRLGELIGDAKTAGAVGRPPQPLRIRALAGAFLTATLDGATQPALDRDDLVEILVDFALRVFR